GPIDLVPEGRKKAERQPAEGEGKPNPPGALPEMVIDQRRHGAGDQTQTEPESVPAEEIINIVMTVLRKGAGAKKNHDADSEEAKDREKQNVSDLPAHPLVTVARRWGRVSRPSGPLAAPPSLLRLAFRGRNARRNVQLRANLQL